jgi:hypothetical protein
MDVVARWILITATISGHSINVSLSRVDTGGRGGIHCPYGPAKKLASRSLAQATYGLCTAS